MMSDTNISMAKSIDTRAMHPAHSVFKRYLLTTGLPADVCTTYADIYRREVMPFLREGAKATPRELKVRPASIVLGYAYDYIANHADELHGSLPAHASEEETSLSESASAANIKELEERLQTERSKYETSMAESASEKSALETNIKELNARVQEERRKYETSMAQKSALETDNKDLKARLQAESRKYETAIKGLNDVLKAERRKYETSVAESTRLNARWQTERRKYETEMAELKARLRDERGKYETEMAEMNARWQTARRMYEKEILRVTAKSVESVERVSLLEKNIASLQKQLSVQERAAMQDFSDTQALDKSAEEFRSLINGAYDINVEAMDAIVAFYKLAAAQYVEKVKKEEEESDEDYEPEEEDKEEDEDEEKDEDEKEEAVEEPEAVEEDEDEDEDDDEDVEEASSSNTCRLFTTALIMLALLGLVFLHINSGKFEQTLNDTVVPHAKYIYAYAKAGLKQALDEFAVPHARYLYAYARSGLSIIINKQFSR